MTLEGSLSPGMMSTGTLEQISCKKPSKIVVGSVSNVDLSYPYFFYE